MTSPNNFALTPQPPATFTYLGAVAAGGPQIGGVLIGDFVNDSSTVPAGSWNNIPTPTFSAGAPVSAQLELQSTTGAFLVMRMTTTQRNALLTPVVGMMIYNTTANAFQVYQGSSPAWVSISAGSGGVVGPGTSVANTVATYADTSGALLADTPVVIDSSGNVSAVNSLLNAVGTAAAPTYSFTARTNTGMYSSAANTLDFATDGTRQLEVGGAVVAVNYLQIKGSTTGNPVLVSALGTDSNISVNLVPKGTGALLNAVGATATPSYSFVGETDTGMWSSAAATVDFSSTGGRNLQIQDSGGTTVNYLTVKGSATGNAVVLGTTGSDSAVNLQLFPKGTTTGQVVHPLGAVATPSITFLARTDTGLYSSAAATIDFTSTGGRNLQIADSGGTTVNYATIKGSATGNAVVIGTTGSDSAVNLQLFPKGTTTGQVVIPLGAVATPSLAFLGETDVGLYTSAAHTLDVAINSTHAVTITGTALQVLTGNLLAGASSGTAGTVTSFPGTASSGSLIMAAVANVGNHTTTISSVAGLAQNEVITIPDAGGATGNFVVAPSALVSGNFLQASGTAGLVVDSGISAATGVTLTASGTISAANFQGMYATPVQLIAAPGSGLGIVVLTAYLELVFATAAPAAGGVIIFQYANTAHGQGLNTIANGGTVTLAATFATSATVTQWATLANGANIAATATSTTTGLGVFLSNQTQGFTANGGTSSLKYAVTYMVVPM